MRAAPVATKRAMGSTPNGPRLGVHRCAQCAGWLALLLAVGCGGDGRRGSADDAGPGVRADGAATANDGGGPSTDGGPAATDGGAASDAAAGDGGSTGPEICDAAGDEDGNGFADCEDPACWATDGCRAAELGDEELAGWDPCGDPVELDAEATAAVCEEGAPGSFSPPERERRCGRIPTTLVLQAYCEPGDGDGRALRYEGRMDTTGEDAMLGPSTYRHVSFESRLGEGQLYLSYAGGGSSGGEPPPLREAWGAEGVAFVGWVTGLTAGTAVRILFFASETESVFTVLDDGGVVATSSDPVFYYTAGLDRTL